MKDLLKRVFFEHWQRKTISLFLAVITWFLVHHSMTSTKTLTEIQVKVINLPPNKTIEGLSQSNIMNNRISLTLMGSKNAIDELTAKDLEVIIDASNKGEEWIASISKKNLICFNPDIDIMQSIHRVDHEDFFIKLSPLATSKIPVYLTPPEGEPPLGYEFLNVWPNELFITLSGPEKTIQELKNLGISLAFNLDNVSRQELNALRKDNPHEVISYSVPASWKLIDIHSISPTPLPIDDPNSSQLRINFVQKEMFPLGVPLPIHLFCAATTLSSSDSPINLSENKGVVEEKNGVFFYTAPLFVRGVNRSLLEFIKNRLELIIFPSSGTFRWSIELQGIEELAEEYAGQEEKKQLPNNACPEEYYIDQFQKYLRLIRFYQSDEEELQLRIECKDKKILVTPKKAHS